MHVFKCVDIPDSSHPPLDQYIAYIHHRTRLDSSVTFTALVLLQRLKACFPTAKGQSGHRLFISALMIAAKVICDGTYSNKSFLLAARGLYSLREFNQMEREMCGFLDWDLTIDHLTLSRFSEAVTSDFSTSYQDYPSYSYDMVSKRARPSAITSATRLESASSIEANISSEDASAHSPRSRSPSPCPDTPSATFSSSSTASASPRTPGSPMGKHSSPSKDHPLAYGRYSMSNVPSSTDAVASFAEAVPCVW